MESWRRAGPSLDRGVKDLSAPDDAASEFKTIIADVLQVDPENLDETQSFLKLGGDSILAIKIMARCRAKGISLDVADLIDARDVADLSQRVSQSRPLAIPEGPTSFTSQNQTMMAKSSEVIAATNGQDINSSSFSFMMANQQAFSMTSPAYIDGVPTSTLLDSPSYGTHPQPLDFIHSALVTATSITTSRSIEDICFYDICETTSEKSASVRKNSHTISRVRTRWSPSNDDAGLLERLSGHSRAISYLDGKAVAQNAAYVSTPVSTSETCTILVDVRQLRQQQGGEERPVAPVSPDFLLNDELGIEDPSQLSLTFSRIGNGIHFSFGANNLWQAHYDLEAFIKVFTSSLKGMLKRIEHHGSKTVPRDSVESQPTRVNSYFVASKNVRNAQPKTATTDTATIDTLGIDALRRILHPETRMISSILPCSPMQEAFLISQSTTPSLYQCCFVLEINNHSDAVPIDARQVGASWGEICKRHSTLRTIFVDSSTRPGHFDQVILDNLDPYIEYTGPQAPQHLSAVEPVTFTPFDPPHRLYLAQASPNVIRLKLEISHALVDGQSTEVLLRDLCQSYLGARFSGQALAYGAFSSYLSHLPRGSSPEYWSNYSSHAQPSFLPMDRGHESLMALEMVATNLTFDSGFIQDFCGAYGVTLSNVCQLAWGLVLRCFTGSDKVSFSYITSGRSAPLEGIHDAVGAFVATLPCCLYLPTTSQVGDLLKALSKDSLEGFSHRYDADLFNDSATSARRLGNTTMSFQRKLDLNAFSGSGLELSLIEKSNPTDVGEEFHRQRPY